MKGYIWIYSTIIWVIERNAAGPQPYIARNVLTMALFIITCQCIAGTIYNHLFRVDISVDSIKLSIGIDWASVFRQNYD